MINPVRRTAACALAGIVLGFGALAGWPSAQQPGQPTLTVPDGFEVVRVAGPPLVERPIVADFDQDGRLYVAESSGSNAKVEQQLAERPHRVLRLEDVDGDGVFDRHGVRRSPHAARGHHVVRRVALRRGAAEHLEADRHRRRWCRGRAGGVVPGQDADRAPTTCTGRISGPTAGSTGPRAPSPSRPTIAPGSRRSSPRPRTSSVAAPVRRPSRRC